MDLLSSILYSERETQERAAPPPGTERMVLMYELRYVRGHVEVYLNGRFSFSADTRGEAEAEIRAREG